MGEVMLIALALWIIVSELTEVNRNLKEMFCEDEEEKKDEN